MRTGWSLLFLFFLLPFGLKAQNIDSALAKISEKYHSEKLYLHYDKSSYYAGETIWFKAYMLEGIVPVTQSKTLYVDWVGDDGSVLSHTVSPIVNGATNGQFDVPENFRGNFVHVRAYTKWMLNFDTAFLYSKDIRIFSKTAAASNKPVEINPSAGFFPEGGDLIAGVPNTIAFKSNDQFGRPVSIKGKVVDDNGAVMQNFVSVHDGMGSFSFVPAAGAHYTVKWTDEKNREHTTALPLASVQGAGLHVEVQGKKRVVTIYRSSKAGASSQQLHLVGTMNESLVFKNDVELGSSVSAKRVIPTDALPSGILTITIFDGNWNAVAERITFIHNEEYTFHPTMEVQHWGLGKRKRNEIEIEVPKEIQPASLSISVTDAAIERDTTDNIISHLLLAGDLRGKVFNPAYYFSNNSDSVAQFLDLVMLTNGWRRFQWDKIAKGEMPEITYPRDSTYLVLSGQVFGVAKSQLSGSETIALIVKGKDSSASNVLLMNINKDGSFSDPSLVIFDTLKVYYSLKSRFLTTAEARFMTDRLPAPNYTQFSKNFPPFTKLYDTSGVSRHTLLATKALDFARMQRGQMMKEVVVKTTKKAPVAVLDEKYTSGMFKGGDGYQFDLVNDQAAGSYMNIFSYLEGKVAGLQINTSSMPPSLAWRGGAPALYLDEMQTDADMISNVPVSDVAYVKVFRPPFMGGFGGGNGAIAIYTRRGGDQAPASGGLSSNTVVGYTPIRQFYSPNYDSFDPRNEKDDVRTTIYWNPLLETSPNKNKIRLTFYNNDVTQSFRVVIEGMTSDGLLTHYEQIME